MAIPTAIEMGAAELGMPALEWQRCLEGDPVSQSQWKAEGDGQWLWQPSGLLLRDPKSEWCAFGWEACGRPELSRLGNFLLEMSVEGQADAAGISFGPFKDFLAPLQTSFGKRRLQLEVDIGTGAWAFRIDGRLASRCWWDSALKGTDDILAGQFTLKARKAEQVLFEGFSAQAFSSSCRISIIMTCYRFQQRLRISLRNWCHQSLPSGAFEILVVNPESPDGTRELLAAAARSFPHVRVREVAVPAGIGKNKGTMINHAFRASRGEWIWLTDADCVFPQDSLQNVLDHLDSTPCKLLYGQRRHLAECQTDGLLSGRLDSLKDFDEIARNADSRPSDNTPWGYTQIVHRSVLGRVAYTERVNNFSQSDEVFVNECRRLGIKIGQVPGLFCLHLHHPFSWYGTDTYL